MSSFREIVHRALREALKADTPEAVAQALPGYIVAGLRLDGFEVHRVGTCVRLPAPPGREMTPDEQVAVGLRRAPDGAAALRADEAE